MTQMLPDSGWSEAHPCLCGFLTHLTYDDKSPRQTGTLTVFLDEGILKAVLKDRDQSLVLFRSARTLEDLFLALEEALSEGADDWRPDHWRKKRAS